MEISLDALLGVQRHGQDLAYRLAQGVSGLLLHVQPPQLPWPAPPLPLKLIPFDIELPAVPFVGGGGVDLPAVAVASFVEIGGGSGRRAPTSAAPCSSCRGRFPCRSAPCRGRRPRLRARRAAHRALRRSARPRRCRRRRRRLGLPVPRHCGFPALHPSGPPLPAPGHRGLPSHAPRRPSSPRAPPSPVLLSTHPASSVPRRRGMRRARPRRPGGWCSTPSRGAASATASRRSCTPPSCSPAPPTPSPPSSSRRENPEPERDITTNSEWERLYQYEIPVLTKVLPDGTEVSIDPLAIHPFFAMFSATQSQVVLISMAILFMLFSVQHFGADKVGYTFVPVISVWFLLIAGIEMYNLVVHNIGVLRAFSPMYIVQYFIRNGKNGWVSLGEIILCVTGTEGMFADLGHFNIRFVQVVYLRKFPHNVANTFYRSIPAPMFWPAFIVAILAGIIASQVMLSRAFAILSKALSLGCMPRVRVTFNL
ncbi:putative high-affinity potassium transporter [Hordeum vulgare]|nr:putative high-affinity potassium transporter [Hordeum vulgare]